MEAGRANLGLFKNPIGLGFYGVLLTLGGVLVTLKWHNGDLVTFSSMAIFDPGNL